NKDKIAKYVLCDTLCIYELYFKAKLAFNTLMKVNLDNHITISTMSYKRFLETSPILYDDLPICAKVYDDICRRAIIGGRAQMFASLECKHKIVSIDCISLYPYVMMNNYFPIGRDPVLSHSYVSGKLGIYEVDILSQPSANIIPFRNNDRS